ncbi:MAG: DNA recombination protein RmuC, partial [Oscillospiraceae bacterium]|nr:DNA recombination protein RmuC [Oscillospiraceae bacterium]
MGLSEYFAILSVILNIAVIILLFYFKKSQPESKDSGLSDKIEFLARNTSDEFQRGRLDNAQFQKDIRDDISKRVNEVAEKLSVMVEGNHEHQSRLTRTLTDSLENLREKNAAQSEKQTRAIEAAIEKMREGNEKRLEQMQGVVDEKLQKTLETRLARSFELVSKQLDSVQQGLGEMKNLAADAKSLKNALTNVKERGTYGEVRLEKLLSDILAPGQYEINVEISDSKRVEFAIKLP